MLAITNNVINISFDARIDKDFNKFSYMKKNRDGPIVRNVKRIIRFKCRDN